MRIYADFNACIDPGAEGRPGFVRLDRLGTLRDLCALRLLGPAQSRVLADELPTGAASGLR
jgi:hypothetical protein